MRRGFKQIISYALIFMLAFSMSFHVNAEEATDQGMRLYRLKQKLP